MPEELPPDEKVMPGEEGVLSGPYDDFFVEVARSEAAAGDLADALVDHSFSRYRSLILEGRVRLLPIGTAVEIQSVNARGHLEVLLEDGESRGDTVWVLAGNYKREV